MVVDDCHQTAQTDLEELEAALARFEAAGKAEASTVGVFDWRQVVDTSNDAFLSVDASGHIVEWNTKAEKLFGWSRDEILGKPLEETILPGDSASGNLGGLKLLAVDVSEGKRLEVTARHRDGSDLPAEISVAAMRDGASFIFNAFVHDISSRRELQAQLAHAQKLESIGQLSAGIAHEINTPTQYVGDNTRFFKEAVSDLMAVVTAYEKLSEALRCGGDTEQALAEVDSATEFADLQYLKDEIDSAIKQSLDGISRVSSIVKAMKEFSHPGNRAKTPIDLSAAIRNTITVATNEWKYVAEVETDFDMSMPAVPCLPGDFNQVILNLIVNGAHAIREVVGDSGDKGVIRVTTRLDGAEAVLSISDNGCGIPDSVVGKVFDPFFTTKKVGVGTGQGLAIARSVVVDKHDGSIQVQTKPGEGTTFTIRLPIS